MKLSRAFTELIYAAVGALRAEDIPYDGTDSIKAKIDSISGGGPAYIPVTTGGTPALNQATAAASDDETHVFTLADWAGTGYDSTKVRAVHVLCKVSYQSTTGVDTCSVTAEYPDGTLNVILEREKESGLSAFGSPESAMIVVPVNEGQTTFELRLHTGPTSSTVLAEFTIVGVTQN
jgi:hypothetical protein